ncbi:MAG: hypothetical protein C0506_02770 [Anaerolinea sp.]|nr:hypothetical protein [Anaerolinea sp.]
MKSAAFLMGAAFGFLVAAARLSDYQVIHDMLLLREPDVFLLMGSAVGVAAPILLILERRRIQTMFGGELTVLRQPVTRRTVMGAAVFGSGWAVAGTCPVPALAMTVSGSGLGLVVAVGLFGGIALRDSIDRKKNIVAPAC